MKKVLITGAGTGFGHEAAMRLAQKGFGVVATVEIWAQVQTLKRQAAARGVTLVVEKLDVTNEGDRKKALSWDIEILVNNAGVLEGGSVLDIPGANMRLRAPASDSGNCQANGQTGKRSHCVGFLPRGSEYESIYRHLCCLKACGRGRRGNDEPRTSGVRNRGRHCQSRPLPHRVQ
jgi:hypothetical protein